MMEDIKKTAWMITYSIVFVSLCIAIWHMGGWQMLGGFGLVVAMILFIIALNLPSDHYQL